MRARVITEASAHSISRAVVLLPPNYTHELLPRMDLFLISLNEDRNKGESVDFASIYILNGR